MTRSGDPDTQEQTEATGHFYDELDHAKDQGRGSCCTMWSFLLLFATLGILGIIALAVVL